MSTGFNMNALKFRKLTEKGYLSEDNPESTSYLYFEVKQAPGEDRERSVDTFISDGFIRVRLTEDEIVGLTNHLNRLVRIWNLKKYKVNKPSLWNRIFKNAKKKEP